MTKTKYACAKDKAFVDPLGRAYQPGQLISDKCIGEIGMIRVQQLIKKGNIVVFEPDAPDAPSVDQARRDAGQTIVSPWVMDPAELEDLSLDDLNLLILDIDEDSEEELSIEAAIDKLTADYREE